MIYFVLTTSVVNKYLTANLTTAERGDEIRRNRYLTSITKNLQILQNYPDVKIVIVENNGNSNTYLNIFNEKFNIPILYTSFNKHNFYHKGFAELYDIKAVIKQFDIKDDDMIIKMTGRYHLMTDYLIKKIIDEQNNYDAFFKFYNVCIRNYLENDCVLGAFGLRAKYLNEFEYKVMNASPEVQIATYVKTKSKSGELRLCEMEDLLVKCIFAENSENMIV
jgi:hypothetical protein